MPVQDEIAEILERERVDRVLKQCAKGMIGIAGHALKRAQFALRRGNKRAALRNADGAEAMLARADALLEQVLA